MQTAGQGSNTNGRRELEFAVVTGAEQRRIEAVLLESCVGPVGDGEVSLGFVVQARDGADVTDEEEDDLVHEEDDNNDPPDVSEVVLDVEVLKTSSRVFLFMTRTLGETTHILEERHCR